MNDEWREQRLSQVAEQLPAVGDAVSKEDFVEALRLLVWLIESKLSIIQKYWAFRARELRVKNIDLRSVVKMEPLDKGARLIIEAEATDETVVEYAKQMHVLYKLMRKRLKNVRDYDRKRRLMRDFGTRVKCLAPREDMGEAGGDRAQDRH